MKIPDKQIGKVTLEWMLADRDVIPLAAIKVSTDKNIGVGGGVSSSERIIIASAYYKDSFLIGVENTYLLGGMLAFEFNKDETIYLSGSNKYQVDIKYIDGDMYIDLFQIEDILNRPKKIVSECLILNKMEIALIEHLYEKGKLCQ